MGEGEGIDRRDQRENQRIFVVGTEEEDATVLKTGRDRYGRVCTGRDGQQIFTRRIRTGLF
jgi:hypothetical protein